MTIGKSSRKGFPRSSLRSPKFLDKSDGFYGRLDEPETNPAGAMEELGREGGHGAMPCPDKEPCAGPEEGTGDPGVVDFHQGMMEDDGASLIHREPARLSSRWRRSSRRRKREAMPAEEQPREEGPSLGMEVETEGPILEVSLEVEGQVEGGLEGGRAVPEPNLVHFTIREEADDQVLIREKRGREEEEEEEERKTRGQKEEMKVVKRSTLRNYRKAFDRALRRGWETFVANLHSVTLTPVTPVTTVTSSPSTRKRTQPSVLVENR